MPLSARQRAALALHAGIAVALVPAFVWLAPPSHWSRGPTLAVLAALAVIADRHDVSLPNGIRFDALIAVGLIAVALGGPLPALAVTLAPMLVNALTGYETLWRAGNLANLASYAAYVLAGALALHGAGFWELLAVGLLQQLVNWALGPAIYGPLWLGHRFRALVHLLRDTLPADLAMLALAAGTVLLTPSLGLGALAGFALIAVLPQSALTYVARTRPVLRLEPHVATRRYAHAIAAQLGLPRRDRRHLDAVVSAMRRCPPTGDPIDYVSATLRDGSRANYDAQLVTERWDGRGTPIGLSQDAIPLASRIVAVAEAWSGLTARGTRELGHRAALAELQESAGRRFDPRVLSAVRAVVARERVSATEATPGRGSIAWAFPQPCGD